MLNEIIEMYDRRFRTNADMTDKLYIKVKERFYYIESIIKICSSKKWIYNFIVNYPLGFNVSISVPIDMNTEYYLCETATFMKNDVFIDGYMNIQRFCTYDELYDELLRLAFIILRCKYAFIKLLKKFRKWRAGKKIILFLKKYKNEFLSRPGMLYYRKAYQSFKSFLI